MKCHETWKHNRSLCPEKTDSLGVLGPSPEEEEVLWLQNHFGVGCEELDLLSVCSRTSVMGGGKKTTSLLPFLRMYSGEIQVKSR